MSDTKIPENWLKAIDEHFPKGECKERGAAMVLIAQLLREGDGFHTFDELYAYRMAYNALLFNEWFKAGKNDVHWSRKHSTGEDCFGGGWFVVVAQTPSGQITNHYELKDLQWFVAIEERERAAEWDGHTPAEAFDRLRKEAWNFSIPF